MKLRKELLQLETDLGVRSFESCTVEEVKEYKKLIKEKKNIPDNILQDGNGWFYRVLESELSENEIKMLLKYRQTDYLRTIRNLMMYFAFLLTIIGFFALIYPPLSRRRPPLNEMKVGDECFQFLNSKLNTPKFQV